MTDTDFLVCSYIFTRRHTGHSQTDVRLEVGAVSLAKDSSVMFNTCIVDQAGGSRRLTLLADNVADEAFG
jgi:hypothetical protein